MLCDSEGTQSFVLVRLECIVHTYAGPYAHMYVHIHMHITTLCTYAWISLCMLPSQQTTKQHEALSKHAFSTYSAES